MCFWRILCEGFGRCDQVSYSGCVFIGLRFGFPTEAGSCGLILGILTRDRSVRFLNIGCSVKPFNEGLVGIHVERRSSDSALTVESVLYRESIWINQAIGARLMLHHLSTLQSIELLALRKINARRVFVIVTKEAVYVVP
jgi:hypothetical protein